MKPLGSFVILGLTVAQSLIAPIQSQRRFSHDTPLERIHGFRKGARLQKRSTASGNA